MASSPTHFEPEFTDPHSGELLQVNGLFQRLDGVAQGGDRRRPPIDSERISHRMGSETTTSAAAAGQRRSAKRR